MNRPFSSYSIDQLEEAFEEATGSSGKGGGYKRQLKALANEMKHRTKPRARALAVKIAAALADLEGVEPKRESNRNKNGGGKKPPRKPTDEQAEAIEFFKRGGSLKINAFAGAGKTSTLEMLAHATRGKGQYLAFNRDIVKEAKERFPATVNCSTTHGIAFRSLAGIYRGNSKKLTDRINANQLSDMLGLKEWQIDATHRLSAKSFGFLVLDALRRFAMSADREPNAQHVARHGSLRAASIETSQQVIEAVLSAAKHTWARMIDAADAMPMGHDGYLKLWALGNPVITADFILMDEAQDTSPVVLELLRNQPAQMIYVGDKYQQIYEWRGAVNAMGEIDTEHTAYLQTSFRFGPEIAEAASTILRRLGEDRPVRGNPSLASRIGPVGAPDAILARSNASTISALIQALDEGKRPHLVGGPDELKKMLRGVIDLKAGKPSEVPDFFGFANWREVVAFSRDGEGEHLQTFVNMVESRGEMKLLAVLGRTVEAEKANVVISTAHKAKGREWKTVRLMDDFLKGQPTGRQAVATKPADESSERRLLYVAITRAKESVELPNSILQLIGRPPTNAREAKSVSGVPEKSVPPVDKEAWKPPGDWKPESTTARPNKEAESSPEPDTHKEPKSFLRRFFG